MQNAKLDFPGGGRSESRKGERDGAKKGQRARAEVLTRENDKSFGGKNQGRERRKNDNIAFLKRPLIARARKRGKRSKGRDEVNLMKRKKSTKTRIFAREQSTNKRGENQRIERASYAKNCFVRGQLGRIASQSRGVEGKRLLVEQGE